MKTILFPTDFSEVSLNAFVYALKFAQKFNASVLVLHQYQLPIVNAETFTLSIKEVYDSIEFQNFENFKSHVPKLRQIAANQDLLDVPLHYILTQGELLTNIKEVVESESVDAIILGTQGASGLKEIFLGSNAGNIISSIDKLIITVPQNAVFNGINNLLFSTRFREKDKTALHQVIKIANKFNAQVHVVNVSDNLSKANETAQLWETEFKDDKIKFHNFENKNVVKTLLDFTKSYEIDMIAMLHYKKSFLQELFNMSVTQKMSYHSRIPLISLNEKSFD